MVMLPFASGQAGKPGNKPVTPNVVFILADDLGIGDLGCYGQTKIHTPGIDQLAKKGMKFTQHYSGSTVSAPSRCCLLTGKHTGHSYVRGNVGYIADDGRKYDLNLAADEVTLGEVFKEKNYVTACMGKWGLGGPSGEGHPNKQGFDYFFGYLGQANAHRYYPDQLFENNTPVMLNKKV
ncbi:MAG: sulfatase-like hydrolase/transferase, partial [Bacteroidales bacterium]|nr:sulfatase-like hydrolase/transferase [Bacteroidales bacterium]